MLDGKFFRKVAPKIRDRYREYIFGADASGNFSKQSRDVYGKKYEGYSTYGSFWVTMNVKKKHKKNAPKSGYSYKQAKESNLFPRQSSGFKKSTNPVLSGDFLRDYSLIRMSSKGFQIGWTSFGARVKHLADKGRVVTSSKQPLPEPVIKYLMDEVSIYIKKHKLMKSKTTRYKIGK